MKVREKTTWEEKVSKVFGLNESTWLNHANPLSVYTRFFIPLLLALAIWTRQWIGMYCLIPIGIVVLWNFLNPLVFPHPKSTKNWASKGTFGERIWMKRKNYDIPNRHKALPNWINGMSSISLIFLVYGLYNFDILTTLAGLVILALGKAWFIDRMVWLYENMKEHDDFKDWEY